MTHLSGSGVSVVRGGRAIVRNVNIHVQSGEFLAIVGANGAGKSTLLKLLAGLLAPNAGTVSLDGRLLEHLTRREIAKRRSYLPQNPRCEWPIPVERLIALGLTPALPAFGGIPAVLQARIDLMLEQWDLLPQRHQAATTLSGGELARAMLARALVADPEIVIADEPTSGLDPRHALDTVARLRALAHSGKMIVASLHDLTLAARYATRIVALSSGTVAADGTPRDILTPDVVQSVFDVRASITDTSGGTFVDFIGLGPASAAYDAAGKRPC